MESVRERSTPSRTEYLFTVERDPIYVEEERPISILDPTGDLYEAVEVGARFTSPATSEGVDIPSRRNSC